VLDATVEWQSAQLTSSLCIECEKFIKSLFVSTGSPEFLPVKAVINKTDAETSTNIE
jgi:hypothetical protein